MLNAHTLFFYTLQQQLRMLKQKHSSEFALIFLMVILHICLLTLQPWPVCMCVYNGFGCSAFVAIKQYRSMYTACVIPQQSDVIITHRSWPVSSYFRKHFVYKFQHAPAFSYPDQYNQKDVLCRDISGLQKQANEKIVMETYVRFFSAFSSSSFFPRNLCLLFWPIPTWHLLCLKYFYLIFGFSQCMASAELAFFSPSSQHA